jgi:hypothetical protein
MVQYDEAMQKLDRLVGTWKVSGGVQGEVRYEWMPGRFFLLQHVTMTGQDGSEIRGMEVIGRLRSFEGTVSDDIHSRYYGSDGSTFDYVYELDGDTLTIWGGERGSPAYFKGTFDASGDTNTGAWVYPGGGGYESTMTRA